MIKTRSAAIDKLTSDLEAFEIDYGQYYSDLEPQWFYDHGLTGELDALTCLCEQVGWSDLAAKMRELLPVQGSAMEALTRVKRYILPEIRHRLEQTDVDAISNPQDFFWNLIHQKIRGISHPRFESGHYGDAVEVAFKEVNDTVKRIFRNCTGREKDGYSLMMEAFSEKKPIIRLNNLHTESDRNIQGGYMQLFAGTMKGIRNPLAHANLNVDEHEALHLICLASLLMRKIDSGETVSSSVICNDYKGEPDPPMLTGSI